MTIYLDLDGTVADLYGDPNWLAKHLPSVQWDEIHIVPLWRSQV